MYDARLDPFSCQETGQNRLVAKNEVQHCAEQLRLGCTRTKLARFKARKLKKTKEHLGLTRNVN